VFKLTLPRALARVKEDPFRLDFKWTDNIEEGDALRFYTDGDTAPNSRFNYRYEVR
jgi:hypothetical protein